MVAGDQRQVQVATGHTRYEPGGLLAVQLDFHAAVARRKALEHRGHVACGVVVGHAQSDQAGQGLALQGRLRLGLQVQHAAGISEQQLAFVGELQLAGPPLEQAVTHGRFQLLELHAHR